LGEYWTKWLYDVEGKICKKCRDKYDLIMNELSLEDTKLSIEEGKKAQESFLRNLESQGLSARKTWSYSGSCMINYERG